MKDLYILKQYFLRYRWHLLLGIGFVVLSNYFRVWQPKLIRKGLDYVVDNLASVQAGEIAQSDVSRSLLLFGGLIIGAAILSGIFMYAMRQTIIVMSRLMEYDMRRDILKRYFELDISFFKEYATGDLMARISEDVSKVRMFTGPVVLYAINVSFLFVLVIYSMLKVSPILTLYALMPLPILSVSIYFVSDIINKKSKRIQELLAGLNAYAQEVYSGIRVVKSFANEKVIGKHFDGQGVEFQSKSLELARVDAVFRPMMMILIGISTVVTVYKGGQLTVDGVISPGNIAEFVIYVNMLTWPVTSIGWMASLTQQAAASQKRINEYLTMNPEILSGAYVPADFMGKIEFVGVSFTYPETGILALDNVSFDIQPGEKVAIIGEVSAGKSTIGELLIRNYDVDSGQILIDGKDIKEYDLSFLRKQYGYVPQVSFLFSDTIASNMRFGKESISDNELVLMAKNIAIYDDIIRLPDGFETMVGERGVTLSGGQKQRIAIVRAFLKDPTIFIFDDSLSAVDTVTEHQILSFLSDSLVGKTALIITHRLSPTFPYSRILLLEKGKILEYGTHQELVDSKNQYFLDLVHT